jgi:ribosomal protein S27E
MGQETTSIYRPRRPEWTGLHLAVRENLELFLETCDERFLDRHGPLAGRARRTLEEYLGCGILTAGFARVRCGDCGHEQLVVFSCQQKRAEIICRFVIDEAIEPVGHRQNGMSGNRREAWSQW